MITNYITTKKDISQAWDKSGKRHAITILQANPVVVTQVKNKEKDGYQAIQVGFGTQKESRISSPQLKNFKKNNLKKFPLLTKEFKVDDISSYNVGDIIANPFKVGDVVNAQGTTKGRGFAGVIKRWGFAGGPRTHGQSDRHRAPGSIGQGTDPGRVHKGKKMAGHYGNETKTITNLLVVHIDEINHQIWLSGLVPGSKNNLVTLTKTGFKENHPELKMTANQSDSKDLVEPVDNQDISKTDSKEEILNQEAKVEEVKSESKTE